MHIQLRFFADMREALGTGQEASILPEQVQTMGDVRAFLRSRGDAWEEALGEGRALRMASYRPSAAARPDRAGGRGVGPPRRSVRRL